METLYEIRTTHNEESFYSLAKMQSDLYGQDQKGKFKKVGYLLIALGGVMFAMFEQSAVAILPVMIGCWLLVLPGNTAKMRAKQMARSLQGKAPVIEYRLGHDGFSVKNDQQQGEADYDSIVNIAEDDRYFYLFINSLTAHVLKKTDFTIGDAATFREFIESRTAMKLKKLQKKKGFMR